jgi:hypothetical protein
MTYFKCTSCEAYLYSGGTPDALVRDLCPGCGTMLEPVGELSEVVGYRSIQPRNDPPRLGTPHAGHGAIIHRFAELLAERRAREVQGALDAERWLDDCGSFSPDAMAAALVDDGSDGGRR